MRSGSWSRSCSCLRSRSRPRLSSRSRNAMRIMNTDFISYSRTHPRVTPTSRPEVGVSVVGVEVPDAWGRRDPLLSRCIIREPPPSFTPVAVFRSFLVGYGNSLNAPSGLASWSRSASKLRGPTAIWVGTTKVTGCWEGWRDFLSFLKYDIPGEGEVSPAPNAVRNTVGARLYLVDGDGGCYIHTHRLVLSRTILRPRWRTGR